MPLTPVTVTVRVSVPLPVTLPRVPVAVPEVLRAKSARSALVTASLKRRVKLTLPLRVSSVDGEARWIASSAGGAESVTPVVMR